MKLKLQVESFQELQDKSLDLLVAVLDQLPDTEELAAFREQLDTRDVLQNDDLTGLIKELCDSFSDDLVVELVADVVAASNEE